MFKPGKAKPFTKKTPKYKAFGYDTKATAKYPYKTYKMEPPCYAPCECEVGHICTRKMGHTGEHEAHYGEGWACCPVWGTPEVEPIPEPMEEVNLEMAEVSTSSTENG